MRAVACIEDLRAAAQRRLPRMIFDVVDGGSYAEAIIRKELNATMALCGVNTVAEIDRRVLLTQPSPVHA